MRSFLPVLALLCASSLPAHAFSNDQSGGVSGSGGGFSGTGTFGATQNGDGSYTITSLTGDTGSGIGSLIAPGGFNGNDNLLFPGSNSQVDGGGFAFTDVQGDTSFQVDIFSSSAGDYSAYLFDSDGFSKTIPVTFSLDEGGTNSQLASLLTMEGARPVSNFSFSIAAVQPPAATPEPSSVILLGSGMLGVCAFARRRFHSA